MVESIYFLKPAWCGTHLAGLRPEQGLQPVTRATALRRWFVTSCGASGNLPFAVRVEYAEREVCMRVIAPFVFLVTFALVQPLAAQTAASCAPAGNIQFVCGQEAPEDLLHLPGSDWVIASSH